jgi:acetylcholinesterase
MHLHHRLPNFSLLLPLILGVAQALPAGDATSASSASAPLVTLDYAVYQGVQDPAGVNQFLGLRYAAAPLGNLRFRAPQDPVKTTGVQDATQVRSPFHLDMTPPCSSNLP